MPRSPQPRLPTDVRQAELAQAALRLAAFRPPADVTTAELAHAIGVSQGAVFRHFESKEALWLATFAMARDALMQRLMDAIERATLPLDALQAMFLAHVAYVVEHPGLPRLIFQELQQQDPTPLKLQVQALMQRYRGLLLDLLNQAVRLGHVAGDTNTQAAAVLFLGSLQGLVMQALIAGEPQFMARQAPAVLALYLRGLVAGQSANGGLSCPHNKEAT